MIPVSEPILDEEEFLAITAAFRRGEISGSFGNSVQEFERVFSVYSGVKHGVAVSNGTTALHLAVAAAPIAAGDKVLVSSQFSRPENGDFATSSWLLDTATLRRVLEQRNYWLGYVACRNHCQAE